MAGGVIGALGWPSANDLVAESDVILAIGTKLGTMDTIDESPSLIDPTRQTLIQVDVEPLDVGWTLPVAVGVTADADASLETALARRADPRHQAASCISGDQGPRGKGLARRSRASDVASKLPRRPGRHRAAQRFIPDDAIVTCDAGENRLFMMRWYLGERPLAYLQPAAGGGMGHAIPARSACALHIPTRPGSGGLR